MSTNLRERAERDLARTLEKEFALPVVLIGPDGIVYATSQNSADPENPDPIVGQVLYDRVKENPDSVTGEQVVVNKPVVTLRRSSLARVPEPGEKWVVRIPIEPSTTAPLQDFMIDPSRAPEGGRSIGFIRLYLKKVLQS